MEANVRLEPKWKFRSVKGLDPLGNDFDAGFVFELRIPSSRLDGINPIVPVFLNKLASRGGANGPKIDLQNILHIGANRNGSHRSIKPAGIGPVVRVRCDQAYVFRRVDRMRKRETLTQFCSLQIKKW